MYQYFRRYLVPSLILFTSCLFTPQLSFGAYIAPADVAPHLCRDNIPTAVKQFVRQEFPGGVLSFTIKAVGEIRCEQSEQLAIDAESAATVTSEIVAENHRRTLRELADMADVVIVVKNHDGELYYNIEHIHFDHDSNFESVYQPKWTAFQIDCEWKKEAWWITKEELKHECLQYDKTPAP